MEIETERLLLRPWKEADLGPYHQLCSDPCVMRWIGDGATRTKDNCRETIQEFTDEWSVNGYGPFALETLEDRQFIGFCGLMTPHFLPEIMPAVEIGWRLARPMWGKGLATEAAKAALSFGFDKIDLDRIVSIYQTGNDASARVMIKIGMEFDHETVDPACNRPLRIYAATKDCIQSGK